MCFFWAGDTLSWLRYMTLKSFRVLNPNWVVNLIRATPTKNLDAKWTTPEEQDCPEKISENYIDKTAELNINIIEYTPERAIHPAHCSDLFQWKWLSNNSGFYSDMDILFTKPMDEFLSSTEGYDTAIAFEHETSTFPIGFVGSCGNNRFFKDLYKVALSIIDNKYDEGCYNKTGCVAIAALCGGLPSPEIIKEKYPEHPLLAFPMDIVYPFRWNEDKLRFGEPDRDVTPHTIGIHWYAAAPLAQRFNELLNEHNYKEYNNLICKYALEINNN